MIHFAYPNVAQGQFLGCGRYVAVPAEAPAPPGYTVATLTEVTNPQAVYAAAQALAPALRMMEVTALVYERRDRAAHAYRGDSLDLAYLLATLSCAWPLQLDHESAPGDIWCTGRITYLAGHPWLDAVAQPGFECKLATFLSDQTPDPLFVVPAANFHQHHKQLCRASGVQIVTLEAWAEAGAWQTKRVLTVAGDELPLLVTTFFALPQQPGEQPDRGRHLLGFPDRVRGREAPLTDAGAMPPGRERVVGPLPGAVVQHFQGRVHELSLLRRYLADEHIRLVWVCGRGGIGKTSLITKLLHELQGRHGTPPKTSCPGTSRASST